MYFPRPFVTGCVVSCSVLAAHVYADIIDPMQVLLQAQRATQRRANVVVIMAIRLIITRMMIIGANRSNGWVHGYYRMGDSNGYAE